jgi:hypothetical protein
MSDEHTSHLTRIRGIMLMVLRNITYGVGATKVRGRTVRREVSHLFAVRATIDAFIFAPAVVFHLPFSEESSA